MANTLPTKAATYVADRALEITTKIIDEANITVTAYNIPSANLESIHIADELTGLAPSVVLRPLAMGIYNDLVAGEWSDPVTLASALTAGQGVKVTLAQADPIIAKKILGVQVGFLRSAGEKIKVIGQRAIPSKFLRSGKVPDQPFSFTIDAYKEGWAEIDELEQSAAAKMYGSIPKLFGFGLGEDGIKYMSTKESFESKTDSVTSKFLTGASSGIKFSVNPADAKQLERVLRALGFNFSGDHADLGAPLQGSPIVIPFDMDIPYITTNLQNRLFAWGISAETLAEATISASLNKKDAFEIDLPWYKSTYIHQNSQVTYSRV